MVYGNRFLSIFYILVIQQGCPLINCIHVKTGLSINVTFADSSSMIGRYLEARPAVHWSSSTLFNLLPKIISANVSDRFHQSCQTFGNFAQLTTWKKVLFRRDPQ